MKRRDFTKLASITALGSTGLAFSPLNIMNTKERSVDGIVPLGVCNHSLRALKLNATELISFAITHKLDTVQFNSLDPFESLEDDYLFSIRQLAEANDIRLYVSVGSVCNESKIFFDNYGDAKTLLTKGIQVAKALDSPVVGVYIGMRDDRYTFGGIEEKIDDIRRLLKSFRNVMLDANLKFAIENHAGDLRTSELVELINATGTDICGALYDSGNAIYAMEDPMLALDNLAKYLLNTTVRDVMIWPTDEGASFQWTAVGEGLLDYKRFVDFMAVNCPGVPINVESISNSPRTIDFLKPEFWDGFKGLPASEIAPFLKLIRRGNAITTDKAPEGMTKKAFDIKHQQNEFLKSIAYLRKECGAGLKG